LSLILIVDDEPSICWGLTRVAEELGHDVETCASAEDGLRALQRQRPDVIVLDVRLPGMTGLEAMDDFARASDGAPIVVVTAYGDLPTAVDAVRKNAFEYIVKPFDVEIMRRAIRRAVDHRNRDKKSSEQVSEVAEVGGMVGQSLVMRSAFRNIALAAASDASVLLTGESGVGKELAARAIHRFSRRCEGPFVAVNVASLSASLAESELFGHVRGAFTGADQSRTGLLLQADGGTLFLDEVADIPMPLQVKLLRALEHREVLPVGASEPRPSDFRIVTATHINLLEHVANDRFRHDLFFRLSGFEIALPALRERPEDIEPLAEHFLDELGQRSGTDLYFTQAAKNELRSRPWYGNVRELRNAVEHAVVVARQGAIDVHHLPDAAPPRLDVAGEAELGSDAALACAASEWAKRRLAAQSDCDRLEDQLFEIVEPPLLRASIEKHRGQCLPAARALGMHRTTLRKKLDQYGIE